MPLLRPRLNNLLLLAAIPACLVYAQGSRQTGRLLVESYTIDAEINPRNQTLAANVQVRATPMDDNQTTGTFELNNALTLARVVDGENRQIQVSRSQQEPTVKMTFPAPLPKGKPTTLNFTYDGKFTGQEESPIYGI